MADKDDDTSDEGRRRDPIIESWFVRGHRPDIVTSRDDRLVWMQAKYKLSRPQVKVHPDGRGVTIIQGRRVKSPSEIWLASPPPPPPTPKFGELILSITMSPERQEEWLGNLAELYHLRRESLGPRAAFALYAWWVAGLAVRSIVPKALGALGIKRFLEFIGGG